MFAVHEFANLRTYAFPALLALVLAAADQLSISPKNLLAILQTAAYLGSSLLLANAVAADRRGRIIVFAVLALNIYALPYLAIGLADSTALVIFQIWLAVIVMQWQGVNVRQRRRLVLIALAGLLAGLAMEIRPAFVWVPVVTLTCMLFLPLQGLMAQLWSRVGRAALCTIFVVLPLLPQMAINEHHFGSLTPLPTLNLQALQVNWGKANLKYATRMEAGQPPQMFYPNPFYVAEEDRSVEQPLDWYVRHPLPAAATLLTKGVAAFDFDSTEPYVYASAPPWQAGLRFASLAILWLGICGTLAQLLGRVPIWLQIGPPVFPLVLLGGWGAVTLASVVELRFSLPMHAVFLMLSVNILRFISTLRWRRIAVAAIAGVVGTTALYAIAQMSREALHL